MYASCAVSPAQAFCRMSSSAEFTSGNLREKTRVDPRRMTSTGGYRTCDPLRFGRRIVLASSSAARYPPSSKFGRTLERDGVARVNCGFGQPWTDELGVAWLPDQKDTGFRAYGCADGVWTSRGEIPILKTGRPSVYRTESSESGKPMVYRFPVKDGTYRVTLHIADTYNQQDRGVKWIFGVGDDIRRVNIWEKAGGTGKTATVHVFENVKPKDGRLTVTFALAVVNGIEIRRVD